MIQDKITTHKNATMMLSRDHTPRSLAEAKYQVSKTAAEAEQAREGHRSICRISRNEMRRFQVDKQVGEECPSH